MIPDFLMFFPVIQRKSISPDYKGNVTNKSADASFFYNLHFNFFILRDARG